MEHTEKQSLCDITKSKILKDYLTEGDEPFLPTERELCDVYQVSRITLREALCGLEARGYVRRIQGRGIQRVNDSVAVTCRSFQDLISRNQVDYHQILEMRFVAERQAARLAAGRATPGDLDRLTFTLRQMEDAASCYDSYLSADLAFHAQVAAASQNLLLSTLVKALQPPLRQCIEAFTDRQMQLTPSLCYHQKLLDAIVKRDAEEAEKQMMHHLITTEALIESNDQLPISGMMQGLVK